MKDYYEYLIQKQWMSITCACQSKDGKQNAKSYKVKAPILLLILFKMFFGCMYLFIKHLWPKN